MWNLSLRGLLAPLMCCGLLASARACDDSDARKSSAKALLEAWRNNKHDEASKLFDEKLMKLVSPDRFKQIWDATTKTCGAFQNADQVRMQSNARKVLIRCRFEKMTLDLHVTFDEKDKIAGFVFLPEAPSDKYKPPTYVKRDAFTESEVTVGGDEWKLPGTLSVPKGKGPFPAVVLVHGSGPHDRDSTILGTKVFRDLAWGLSSRGIAVLRYEKRTKQHGATIVKQKLPMTLDNETVIDAVRAVKLLKRRKEIDGKRIVVIGHSLGAMAAPGIAARSKDVAGIVMLAGNARPLEDVIYDQFVHFAKENDGKISEDEQKELDKRKKKVDNVKSDKLSKDTPAKDLLFGVAAEYWLSLRAYKQIDVARRVKQPMLILQGERDYQVTMKDFELWKKTLKDKKNVTLKSYPKLNHNFVPGEGVSLPAEYFKEGHVDGQVIVDVADWIKKN